MEATKAQARELVDHLYLLLLEADNDEIRDPARVRKAQADYAAAEAWYSSTYNVNLEVK